MLQNFKSMFEIDNSLLKIIKIGFKISIVICSISIICLLIYCKYYISHDLYEGSIILFKTGLLYAIQFFICGIAINKIRQMQ